MHRKLGFGLGAFILVAAFTWVVFDNLALGLLFGLLAGGAAGKSVRPPEAARGQEESGAA
jgi:hypothetical protein